MELAASSPAVEFPIDFDAVPIHAAVPGAALLAQCLEIGDSSLAQALPRKEADFDLRLIEPASVGGREMNPEAIPDLFADLLIEVSVEYLGQICTDLPTTGPSATLTRSDHP